MLRYIGKRILGLIPIILALSVIFFAFIHLIPGDPVRLMIDKEATIEDYNRVKESLGLNQPLWKQYIDYMVNLFHGDLGTSYKTGLPVSEMFASRLGPTIRLTITSIIWSVLVGLFLGIISAVFRGKWADYLGMIIATSGISVPTFWLGLMLIQVFAVQLGWVKSGGLDEWSSYILPSITMGVGIMGIIARFSRSSMMENLNEDYVRTARAKGQKEWKVIVNHALRNSLVQVVTIIGLQIGALLAGSVLVETVFSISGLGRLMVDALAWRDYQLIQAILMFFSIEYLVINLIVDVLYGILNPKIRYAN